MPYLDKEEKFYDYRTAEIDGDNIFDIHKASNSDAQQILDGSTYWKEEKNTFSKIVQMTPYEYFKACAEDCFNETAEELIASRGRDTHIIEHLKQVLQIYKKRFPIPYIDYATHYTPSQEGLHRMYVAGELYGWNKKFPVQIIDWVDKDRAKREKYNKHKREIERYMQRALDQSLRYKYYNMNEFKDQLYSDLENEFRFVDEFEDRRFDLQINTLNEDEYEIIVDGKYVVDFDRNRIMIEEKKIDPNTDLEDIDLDDLSDWMKDLLDEIHLEKSRLTERYALPEEFLKSNQLLTALENKFGKDYYNKPICKAVCEYVGELCPQAEVLKFMIAVWKYDKADSEIISNKGHCVIRYKDLVYDYTSGQYNDYDITPAKSQPRILRHDEALSKRFECDIYRDDDYMISVY